MMSPIYPPNRLQLNTSKTNLLWRTLSNVDITYQIGSANKAEPHLKIFFRVSVDVEARPALPGVSPGYAIAAVNDNLFHRKNTRHWSSRLSGLFYGNATLVDLPACYLSISRQWSTHQRGVFGRSRVPSIWRITDAISCSYPIAASVRADHFQAGNTSLIGRCGVPLPCICQIRRPEVTWNRHSPISSFSPLLTCHRGYLCIRTCNERWIRLEAMVLWSDAYNAPATAFYVDR